MDKQVASQNRINAVSIEASKTDSSLSRSCYSVKQNDRCAGGYRRKNIVGDSRFESDGPGVHVTKRHANMNDDGEIVKRICESTDGF
jgi:hypothetical protein